METRAAIQSLESVMWRGQVLTATAHELVEGMEEPGSEPSDRPAVPSDARTVSGHRRARARARSVAAACWLSAAQVCGVLLGLYAIFFDRLTNVGLLVAASGASLHPTRLGLAVAVIRLVAYLLGVASMGVIAQAPLAARFTTWCGPPRSARPRAGRGLSRRRKRSGE